MLQVDGRRGLEGAVTVYDPGFWVALLFVVSLGWMAGRAS